MKHLIITCAAMLLAWCASAQQLSGYNKNAVLPSNDLQITWHKTTLLIFPSAIQAADRGDSYVLAEKIKGVENMLRVKAGQKDFTPSNLHVVTLDGSVYDFNVVYKDQPDYQTLDLRKQPPYAAAVFQGVSLNSKQLALFSAEVTGSRPFLKGVHDHEHGLSFTLDGIYIKDDVLFLRYWLKNNSHIPFTENSLRFFIRDRKKAKRTSDQDSELQPLLVTHSGSPENERGQIITVAFAKFTIADSKRLVTELMEQNGDRNPACKLSGDKLLQARPLR